MNFASQCFDAGTRQLFRNTSWKPYTSTWISSTSSINYWQNKGWRVDNTDASWISAGQMVYYDWDGIGGGKTYYHTAFCVGTDSNNVPIVNSHNKDYKHVRWNYGGQKCKYATVVTRG